MKRDRPGRMIAGRYELLEPAGEGGMATVWRAVVRGAGRFARPVAVKRILANKTTDAQLVRLFEEEARVGADLHHPNIVQILDFGVDEEGDYYLVMEWMDGLDLHQWVRSHPSGLSLTPWPLVATVAVETLRGLAAAHGRLADDGRPVPVFHRDISPSNVLLGTHGAVKLTDFGLARAMDRASMTRPNVIKGKLAYCAPELISGADPSARSDLFAVGVVIWESLAQRRLFTGRNDVEVLLAIRRGGVERLDELRQDLPRDLVDAVHRALASAPEERFATATEMARTIARVLKAHPEPIDAEPLGKSVREARQRLGLPARTQRPVASPLPDIRAPEEPSGRANVRGLWTSTSTETSE